MEPNLNRSNSKNAHANTPPIQPSSGTLPPRHGGKFFVPRNVLSPPSTDLPTGANPASSENNQLSVSTLISNLNAKQQQHNEAAVSNDLSSNRNSRSSIEYVVPSMNIDILEHRESSDSIAEESEPPSLKQNVQQGTDDDVDDEVNEGFLRSLQMFRRHSADQLKIRSNAGSSSRLHNSRSENKASISPELARMSSEKNTEAKNMLNDIANAVYASSNQTEGKHSGNLSAPKRPPSMRQGRTNVLAGVDMEKLIGKPASATTSSATGGTPAFPGSHQSGVSTNASESPSKETSQNNSFGYPAPMPSKSLSRNRRALGAKRGDDASETFASKGSNWWAERSFIATPTSSDVLESVDGEDAGKHKKKSLMFNGSTDSTASAMDDRQGSTSSKTSRSKKVAFGSSATSKEATDNLLANAISSPVVLVESQHDQSKRNSRKLGGFATNLLSIGRARTSEEELQASTASARTRTRSRSKSRAVKSDDMAFEVGAARSKSSVLEQDDTVLAQAAAEMMTVTPLIKELSFLECLVNMMRGTLVKRKRKGIRNFQEYFLYLSEELDELHWVLANPKEASAGVERHGDLRFVSVERLKSSGADLLIEGKDDPQLEIQFASRDEADMWTSGLCCLVPIQARVKTRAKSVELGRENYNMFLDAFQNKPLYRRQRVDRFIILSQIGDGANSVVKLALSMEDNRFYAVKVVAKALLRKQTRGGVFNKNENGRTGIGDNREIAIMKKLNHPHVVHMKDVFDDPENDCIYIILEYMPSGYVMSSAKLDGGTPMDENNAREVFLDVLSGLEYLHRQGVLHRDLKPENLLRKCSGVVKISDFGSAKLIDGASTNASVGTPAFSPPELCLSDKAPLMVGNGCASDVWSLGVTLYYMLYGRVPFIANGVFAMYEAICTRDLQFPESTSVSDEAVALMSWMLKKNELERPTIDQLWKCHWVKLALQDEDCRHRDRILSDSSRDNLVTISQNDLDTAIRKTVMTSDPNQLPEDLVKADHPVAMFIRTESMKQFSMDEALNFK